MEDLTRTQYQFHHSINWHLKNEEKLGVLNQLCTSFWWKQYDHKSIDNTPSNMSSQEHYIEHLIGMRTCNNVLSNHLLEDPELQETHHGNTFGKLHIRIWSEGDRQRGPPPHPPHPQPTTTQQQPLSIVLWSITLKIMTFCGSTIAGNARSGKSIYQQPTIRQLSNFPNPIGRVLGRRTLKSEERLTLCRSYADSSFCALLEASWFFRFEPVPILYQRRMQEQGGCDGSMMMMIGERLLREPSNIGPGLYLEYSGKLSNWAMNY